MLRQLQRSYGITIVQDDPFGESFPLCESDVHLAGA